MRLSSPSLYANRPAVSGAASLARNLGQHGKNFAYGLIHNTDQFKVNALILSAFIQVASRIYISHRNASRAKDQPDGPFLRQEAIKTTFREAGGFTMSYTILRYGQRLMTDLFRNVLGVSGGLTTRSSLLEGPTMFNGLMRRTLAPAGTPALVPGKSGFPGLLQTLGNMATDVKHRVTGSPLKAAAPADLKKLVFDLPKDRGIILSAAGQARYQASPFLKSLVNKVNWLVDKMPGGTRHNWANMEPRLAQALKLKTFFTWAPILVSSVPAMLLAGYALERFSQRYSETLAQKIAKSFVKPGPVPANPGQSFTPGIPSVDPDFRPEYVNGDAAPIWEPTASFFEPALTGLSPRNASVASAFRLPYAGGISPQPSPFMSYVPAPGVVTTLPWLR